MGKNLTKMQKDFLNKIRREGKIKSNVPKGFKKAPSGGRVPYGYTAYIKGSLFDPVKYGEYQRIYVKNKK